MMRVANEGGERAAGWCKMDRAAMSSDGEGVVVVVVSAKRVEGGCGRRGGGPVGFAGLLVCPLPRPLAVLFFWLMDPDSWGQHVLELLPLLYAKA